MIKLLEDKLFAAQIKIVVLSAELERLSRQDQKHVFDIQQLHIQLTAAERNARSVQQLDNELLKRLA